MADDLSKGELARPRRNVGADSSADRGSEGGPTPGVVPLHLATFQPSRWEDYPLSEFASEAITLLYHHIRSAKDRFADASARGRFYEVIFGAIATFNDGSHSSVSLNIPRITSVNRCAEAGLVAHIEGEAALGVEQRGIRRLTLMGLPLGDESGGFSTHPNPCARCRDRLEVLASLGTIARDTEILIVALNRDGSLPAEGRLTSYGDLLALARDHVEYQRGGLVMSHRGATVASVVEALQEHFSDVPLDRSVLKVRIARALRGLRRGKDSSLVAGISPEGCLEMATSRPSVVVVRHKSYRFSAETGGVVSAVIGGWKNLFFLNVTAARRPSSVTLQRYLDLVHHLHTKGENERVKILQVSMVSSRGDRFFIDEIDLFREFPLGEGPIHRGRCGLVEAETGQLRFSSKLGLSRVVVAKLLSKVEIERQLPSSDGEVVVFVRKSRNEKITEVQSVLGGPAEEVQASYLRVTQSTHCTVLTGDGEALDDSLTRVIARRLGHLLDGAENFQKRTNPQGGARYPLVAVLGTRSGEPVPRFAFVSPCPTGYEEPGVDPIVQALAELLHLTEPDTGPDALHIAWRGAEPLLGEEHEGLMRGVREVLGRKIRLVAHRDMT